jgi:hypothetical protein
MKELNTFRQYLAEGEIKENEEQGYTLYDTNVEYDNGKTGYMFQLVNSEDGEENEIGFDQLYFDDEDNRLEVGVDFNSFDQGSYQEGEYTADEAMELYRKISEGVIKENEEQGYTLYDTKVEYDNGKTGYMIQLVNSEDGEENEIGFDQLYFDDEDNRLEMGVDFNSFDQGSYQEGEYTADEAMELYRKIN